MNKSTSQGVSFVEKDKREFTGHKKRTHFNAFELRVSETQDNFLRSHLRSVYKCRKERNQILAKTEKQSEDSFKI